MTKRYQPWRTKPLPDRVPAVCRKLVVLWQKRLELSHWGDIPLYMRVMKDSAAEIRWPENYKNAAIAFNTEWVKAEHRTHDDYEKTVVHELLHLVFADLDDTLQTQLGLGTVLDSYANKREGLCDALATLFIARYKRSRES